MSGAASDSFSLISILQLGQVIVGSFMASFRMATTILTSVRTGLVLS